MVAEPLDKCPLKGSLPDGTCRYVARAYREGYGKICKKHAYRLDTRRDPYATPLPEDADEPTYEEINQRRERGDLSRNA